MKSVLVFHRGQLSLSLLCPDVWFRKEQGGKLRRQTHEGSLQAVPKAAQLPEQPGAESQAESQARQTPHG